MTSDEWAQETGGRSGALPAPDLEPLELGAVSVTADPDVVVVRFVGEVDMSMAADLAEASREAIDLGRPIRLDVAAVTFIDSTAITYIVGMAAAERDAGRTLLVLGADRRTTDTFQLTGITELVQFADAEIPAE